MNGYGYCWTCGRFGRVDRSTAMCGRCTNRYYSPRRPS